jgi:transcriptional antiterminator NusG
MEPKWYVIRTFAGHETKVKTMMETELRDNESLQAKIHEILVPIEKIFEVKDGKKRARNKNFFPGYLFIDMDLDLQVKEFILNTPSVMDFLGNRNNPQPLQPDDVRRIIGRVKQSAESQRVDTIFRSGDIVKIIDGPFNNFTGSVEEVNEERMKIKVLVSIFGRKTPVEIDFVQAELEK